MKGKKKQLQGGKEFAMRQPKSSISTPVQASCAPNLHLPFGQTGKTMLETEQSLGKVQDQKKFYSFKIWGERGTTG